MPAQVIPYMPQTLKVDSFLWYDLRKHGSIAIEQRLEKAKKRIFPTRGSPAELSRWWGSFLKNGKKKDKYAMIIMASEYEPMLELLDKSKQKTSELGSKVMLQEEEINTLKMRLQAQEEENKRLRMYNEQIKLMKNQADEEIKTQKLKLESKKQDINILKAKLEQMQISQDLVSCSQTIQIYEDEIRSAVPLVTADTRRAQLFHFYDQLPDLEEYNFNYDFWKKIREWFALGLTLDEVFCLVKAKCSPITRRKVLQELAKKNLCDTVSSNPAHGERLLNTMQECVSEALGAGTKLCYLFTCRNQEDGESFEDYIKEKYRLYCAYGCEKGKTPGKNDPCFLLGVLLGIPRGITDKHVIRGKSYVDLLTEVSEIEQWMRESDKRNFCTNCKKKGHIKAKCRKHGGGAEVGPNNCFKCGKRGHWARNCWK